MRFLEHRIADRRLLRLIGKWLEAGVLEDGRLLTVERGTPQGAVISPVLANIYLHYVYDLWVHQWRRQNADGNVVVVRYADDTVVGFERRSDAERFVDELRQRLQKFGLELHPQKTRIIEFGRFAARNRKAQGRGKPETFAFLGFTHICVLRDQQAGKLSHPAAHHSGTTAGTAPAGQRDDKADDAPADRRARAVPEAGGERLSQLLCRSHQQPGDQCLLL